MHKRAITGYEQLYDLSHHKRPLAATGQPSAHAPAQLMDDIRRWVTAGHA